MFLTLIDRLGEHNPQLFRELKGRMTNRNVLTAVAVSAIGQVMVVLYFSQQHCMQLDNATSRCVEYYWEFNWLGIFITLAWTLPLVLFAAGVYLLCGDLAKEENRGTLNFIRLSPRSSQSILLGKVLGVPMVLYLAIAIALPLHLRSGLEAGVPLSWVLGFYILIAVGCCFLYSAALLNTLLTKIPYQALTSSLLTVWLGSSYIGLITLHFNWDKRLYLGYDWKWFVFPVGRDLELLFCWMVVTVSIGCYWMWQALNRRFSNPNATLLNKKQSYWVVGSFQVWLLGLFWPFMNSTPVETSVFGIMFLMCILNLIVLLPMIAAISPNRQALQDWARYKPSGTQKSSIRGLWRELMVGEKSPAVVAIAINIGIVAAIWLPWMLLWQVGTDVKMQAIAGFLLSFNLIWIYAAIAQLVLFMKMPKQGIWASSSAIAALALPPIVLGLLFDSVNQVWGLWMFSVFGASWIAVQEVSAITIFLSLLGQFAVMAGLSLKLTKQIERAGESTSKSLLAKG